MTATEEKVSVGPLARLPVGMVERIHRAVGGDPVVEEMILRFAASRYGVLVGGGQLFDERRMLRRFVAGTDVFSRQSDGTTIADQYARMGLTLRQANMDRVNGWAEVQQGFGDPDAGIKPKLFIHQRCGRLIETLPSLQHDPNRPEDVLKVDADEEGLGGDDAADCLRYLLATKARTVVMRRLRGL